MLQRRWRYYRALHRKRLCRGIRAPAWRLSTWKAPVNSLRAARKAGASAACYNAMTLVPVEPRRLTLAGLAVAALLFAGWFRPPCACHRTGAKHLAEAGTGGLQSYDRSAADGHACCGGGERKGSSGSHSSERPVGSSGCCPGDCAPDCTSPCSLGKPVVAPASTPETLVGPAAFSDAIGDGQSGAPPSPAPDSVFHPPRG